MTKRKTVLAGDEAAVWCHPTELAPWPKNPRRNDGEPVEAVIASIKRFGFGSPITARRANNEIIGGHTRWKAATAMGLDRVPVRFLDLSEKEAHLLALADNRLNEKAAWDVPMLKGILDTVTIGDAAQVGFSADDVSVMADQVMAEGGQLELVPDGPIVVQRWRTALTRHTLSMPARLLLQYALTGNGFMDYGCGRGDDVRILRAAGVDAHGWDPHFAPLAPKVEAGAVNLGFVLNVIEDVEARSEALLGAWALTTGVLSISVICGSGAALVRPKRYSDGVLTNRGTFQRFYSADELREYVGLVLGVDPVQVTTGVVYAFRDPAAAELFLATRKVHEARVEALKADGNHLVVQAVLPGDKEREREMICDIAEGCGGTWELK
jgi:hypothetical protein